MNPHFTSSPVSLSYIAALRGIKPRRPGEAFVYAEAACREPALLACLAASNPEGQFYGLLADEVAGKEAQLHAAARGVPNIIFMSGTPTEALPILDYLCCDESQEPLTDDARQAVFNLAQTKLKPGGLFNYTYRAYAQGDSHLRFLVREVAPEMSAEQAQVFLHEIKKLGASYLAAHADVATRLDQAIAKNLPDEFFDLYEDGEARSGTFDTIVAMRARGLAYAGDSNIASNYVELSVPPEAQQLVINFRDNHLYEPIKDLALDRTVRADIWCRMPVEQISDTAQLFGGFVYGVTLPRDKTPLEVQVKGKTIDVSSPLYASLIDLMALIPAGVGDFLAHPSGQGFTATEVVGAIQILVACGLAQPMRGGHQLGSMQNVAQPRLVGAFNRHLAETQVMGDETWMSSQVIGAAVAVPVREALVMQALNRAGLADSVSALLPELQRLARSPSQGARIMDATEPTAEFAHEMIEDVVGKSIVQWYAYGLLEAA